MLGEALFDLPRLFVGVHVERQRVLRRVAAELAQRLGRAGPDGVGGDPDADARVAQRLQLTQIRRHRLLPETRDAASQVARVEADEGDPRFAGCFCRRLGLLVAEIVELADRRVAVLAKLPVDLAIFSCGSRPRVSVPATADHLVAPAPEVAATPATPQYALKRMAVGVDESRDGQHGHILSA